MGAIFVPFDAHNNVSMGAKLDVNVFHGAVCGGARGGGIESAGEGRGEGGASEGRGGAGLERHGGGVRSPGRGPGRRLSRNLRV